jgi:hypothetical protein
VRRVALALVFALALPAAAEAANPVVAAAQKTSTARSTKLQLHMRTSVSGAPAVVMTGGGATSGQRVTLRMNTTVVGQSIAMDAIGLVERGHYVMYMRSPVLQAQLPRGKTWLRIDLQTAGGSVGLDFASLIGQEQTLAPLEHGLVSTKRLGTDRVAGKAATHYRAVVDVRKAALALPAYAKQLATVERATGMRLGRVTQDVWVGSDGRIRRLRTTTPTVSNGARGKSVQTLTFLAYDVPVSISAPARAKVFDAS